eukprot:COSAG01_NODE_63901_length_278_cov_0.865922_1_plen_54_part_01
MGRAGPIPALFAGVMPAQTQLSALAQVVQLPNGSACTVFSQRALDAINDQGRVR